MKSFWTTTDDDSLAQGDYVQSCLIPVFAPDYGSDDKEYEVPVAEADLIIVTQSCDLENEKIDLVAMCSIFPIVQFEEINPMFTKRKWEEVRKGRIEGLHLLSSPTNPENNYESMVVDFRAIYSLPLEYIKTRVIEMGDRWRLDSPYLEHFSQSFARFFMRVGLPSSIPPFK